MNASVTDVFVGQLSTENVRLCSVHEFVSSRSRQLKGPPYISVTEL
jgi:hypothetical protein